MEGYKVFYKDKKGRLKNTFFGKPESNVKTDMSETDMVRIVFGQNYPKCKIISVVPTTFEFEENS